METIIAFVWGAVTVFYIGMAVAVFQIRKQLKEVESGIKDTNDILDSAILKFESMTDDTHRTIDGKEKELYNYSTQLDQNLRDELEKLYSYIDSRFDKFESRIKSEKPLDEIQKVKTQLDEFIRAYQNQ
jgi:protein associated with RNAse G/E